MTDVLREYALRVLDTPGLVRRPALERHDYALVRAKVIDRAGDFQTELYVVGSGGAAGEHRHPHVDSYEVLIRGAFVIALDGVPFPGEMIETPGGKRYVGVRVRPDQPHMALESSGGAFLSIQHWLGAPPTSIGLDWVGPATSPMHEHLLEAGRG